MRGLAPPRVAARRSVASTDSTVWPSVAGAAGASALAETTGVPGAGAGAIGADGCVGVGADWCSGAAAAGWGFDCAAGCEGAAPVWGCATTVLAIVGVGRWPGISPSAGGSWLPLVGAGEVAGA